MPGWPTGRFPSLNQTLYGSQSAPKATPTKLPLAPVYAYSLTGFCLLSSWKAKWPERRDHSVQVARNWLKVAHNDGPLAFKVEGKHHQKSPRKSQSCCRLCKRHHAKAVCSNQPNMEPENSSVQDDSRLQAKPFVEGCDRGPTGYMKTSILCSGSKA